MSYKNLEKQIANMQESSEKSYLSDRLNNLKLDSKLVKMNYACIFPLYECFKIFERIPILGVKDLSIYGTIFSTAVVMGLSINQYLEYKNLEKIINKR